MKQRNTTIDLFRLVCAFFVVVIHCQLPIDHWLAAITRGAALFPVISGYVIADAGGEGLVKKRLNQQLRHLFFLLAGLGALFLGINLVVSYCADGRGPGAVMGEFFQAQNFMRLLTFSATTLFYPVASGHLWYLMALLCAFALLRLLLEYKPSRAWVRWLPAVGGAFSLVVFFTARAGGAQMLYRNALLVLFYVMIGMWMRHNRERLERVPGWAVVALPVIFVALGLAERALPVPGDWRALIDIVLLRAPLCASMLLLCMRFPKAGEGSRALRRLSRWGREYSLGIYVIHNILLRVVVNKLVQPYPRWLEPAGVPMAVYAYGLPAAVFLGALAAAAGWSAIRRRVGARG